MLHLKKGKIHYLDYNLRLYECLYLTIPSLSSTMAQTGHVQKNVRMQASVVLPEWKRNTKWILTPSPALSRNRNTRTWDKYLWMLISLQLIMTILKSCVLWINFWRFFLISALPHSWGAEKSSHSVNKRIPTQPPIICTWDIYSFRSS